MLAMPEPVMRIHHDIEFMKLRKKLKSPSSETDRIALLEQVVALRPRDPKNRHLQRLYREELGAIRLKRSQHRHHADNPYDGISYRRQVVLVGGANTGKSTLLGLLTGSAPEVSDTPYATYRPEHGLADCRDVPVQVVEVPAFFEDDRDENKYRFVRNADVIGVCARDRADADLAGDVLKAHRVSLVGRPAGGHRHRALDAVLEKPGFVAAWTTIADAALPTCPVDDVEAVKAVMYRLLGIRRVYCLKRGEVQGRPLVFGTGEPTTVADFIERLDKRFVGRYRRARIAGSSAKFDGETVGTDHELGDGDRVELVEH